MPIRQWATSRDRVAVEKVLLLHGRSGSWLHWIRNIPALREHLEVYAIDLPGLGDAAMCEIPSDAASAAAATRVAITRMFPEGVHLVAFSWGCTITAMIMRDLAPVLRSVMLTGPAAVGDLPRRVTMKPLIKRTAGMSLDEVLRTQRENLARLMIYQPDRIDEAAVLIQEANTAKARFKSPPYARSTLVIEGVSDTTTPLYVIYGDHDAPAYPGLAEREALFRKVRPDVRFELVPDAGHWLQYEKAELFNQRCLAWIGGID